MDLHDIITEELINKKSLSALIWLINRGRELEFRIGENLYFISTDKSTQNVSLWKNKQEQSFNNMEELINNSTIDGIPFLSLWNDVIIETLF